MSGLGHNNGPTMEAGYAWRKHSWSKARRELLPTLPIEILRSRVARAKALGLPYKTYASVRAASGHDVIGFLFSNNALRVVVNAGQEAQQRLDAVAPRPVAALALSHRPMRPEVLEQIAKVRGVRLLAEEAPDLLASWSEQRDAVLAPLRRAGLPRDGVLVIGDTALEREWSEAGRLAGFLHSDRYFASATP